MPSGLGAMRSELVAPFWGIEYVADRAGSCWSEPRFTRSGNGYVTDRTEFTPGRLESIGSELVSIRRVAISCASEPRYIRDRARYVRDRARYVRDRAGPIRDRARYVGDRTRYIWRGTRQFRRATG